MVFIAKTDGLEGETIGGAENELITSHLKYVRNDQSGTSCSGLRPWWDWRWGALPPGRFVVSRRVGALVFIRTGECWAPRTTRPGVKNRRIRFSCRPGGGVVGGPTRLLNRPFRGWLFGGFLREGRFAAVSISAFLAWWVWCWGAILPGAVCGFASGWVLVLIPSGECWATRTTRPGAKQRRIHRPIQPGEARLLNHPLRCWLFWRVHARGLSRRFRFSEFLPWWVWCWGDSIYVFIPTDDDGPQRKPDRGRNVEKRNPRASQPGE